MNPIDLSPLLQGQPEFVQRIVIELFPFLLALILILLLRWLLTPHHAAALARHGPGAPRANSVMPCWKPA